MDKFDPRMPHPRKIISRNYHHIEKHPIVSKIFPRGNLIASCKRLPNLGEILSPTVQKTNPSNTNNLDPEVKSLLSSIKKCNVSKNHIYRRKNKPKCYIERLVLVLVLVLMLLLALVLVNSIIGYKLHYKSWL